MGVVLYGSAPLSQHQLRRSLGAPSTAAVRASAVAVGSLVLVATFGLVAQLSASSPTVSLGGADFMDTSDAVAAMGQMINVSDTVSELGKVDLTPIWHNDLHVDPVKEGLSHQHTKHGALKPWVSQPTIAVTKHFTFCSFESHDVHTVIMRSSDLKSWERIKTLERCFMGNLFVPSSGVLHLVCLDSPHNELQLAAKSVKVFQCTNPPECSEVGNVVQVFWHHKGVHTTGGGLQVAASRM